MPKILLADDNLDMLETLEQIFVLYQFDVVKAENGIQAVDKARETRPDIILLDGMMPEMDGFEACKILKNTESTKDIPVVFLTANYTATRDRINGLELGADDYLLKPFNSKELVARTQTVLKRSDMMRSLRSENTKLISENEHLQKESARAGSESLKQGIINQETGLYTREFFMHRLEEEFARAIRYNQSLTLVMIELTNFNQLSEKYGQQVSEFMLMRLANFFLSTTRISDILMRDDQSRFLILMPQTPVAGGENEAHRFHQAIEQDLFIDNETRANLPLTKHKGLEALKFAAVFAVTEFSEYNREKLSSHHLLLNYGYDLLKKAALTGAGSIQTQV